MRILIKELLARIATTGNWVIKEPTFVDTIEDPSDKETDIPIETLGGIHEIYAPTEGLPRAVDALHLEETERIVESVRKLSGEQNLEFEFELDGRYVGTISDGVVDMTLSKGLLDEWRKHIATL